MEKGKIKELRVNQEKDIGAVLFEDGESYYIPLNTVREIYGVLGNPIGSEIEFECDGRFEDEPLISCVWFV